MRGGFKSIEFRRPPLETAPRKKKCRPTSSAQQNCCSPQYFLLGSNKFTTIPTIDSKEATVANPFFCVSGSPKDRLRLLGQLVKRQRRRPALFLIIIQHKKGPVQKEVWPVWPTRPQKAQRVAVFLLRKYERQSKKKSSLVRSTFPATHSFAKESFSNLLRVCY